MSFTPPKSGNNASGSFANNQQSQQQQQQANFGGAPQPGSAGGNAASAFQSPFGFQGVNLLAGRPAYAPLSGSMGSEAYMKMMKEMRELVESQKDGSGVNVHVLQLDKSFEPNLHYDCFLFASQSKTNPELGVGYNICIMAGTGSELPSTQHTINGETVSIPSFAEKANDAKLNEIAQSMLVKRFGSVPLYSSDSAVIPADFNFEDKMAIFALAENAAAAATNSMVMRADGGRHFNDLNLITFLKSRKGDAGDADLTFLYNFQPKDSFDYLKLPQRASILIQAQNGYRKNNNEHSVNSGFGPRTVTEATGFIELMPSKPRNAIFMQQQLMAGQTAITQRLAPVLVLNSVRTNFAQTPAALALAVLTASDLNTGAGWVAGFHNKTGMKVGNIDMTDVTAITADMPSLQDPTKPVDRPAVPAGGMPIDMLMSFLGTYCESGLYIAQDVPVASHTTWYLSIISEAASGNTAAYEALVRGFDTLLGGKFASALGNTHMFAGKPMAIERGYWSLNGGERRDTAEIDYVAVCNYADATNNPMLIEKWTDSFLNLDRPQALRLQDRRDIISEITGHTAVFYGRSKRVFWNGAALKIALDVLANSGITTSSDGRSSFAFGGNRAHAAFLKDAALPMGAGWQQSNGFGAGAGYSFGGMGSTPWG